MRPPHNPILDARWPAVHQLVDRWAALPAGQWRLLLDAERVAPAEAPPDAPSDYEQWLVRDLVQTAWWMARRTHRGPDEAWMAEARAALERAALRLIQPSRRSHSAPESANRRQRFLRHG